MEQQTFIEHIQKHSGIIQKVIYLYVDDPDDKNDLRQEIILQAWQAIGRFRGESAFSTWLYRVALNTVFTFNRKQNRLRTEQIGERDITEEGNTDHPAADRLYAAIRSLSDIDKSIITLHLEDYDNTEIAEIMGMTKNHVAVKLHRVKTELTKKLNGK